MIELISFPKPKSLKLISNSPFCAKTEIFLKLAKIDYKLINFKGDPGKFSKGKLPVIKHDDEIIEDSTFIQIYLEEKFKPNLDSHLTDYEKAQGFAFSKMIEQYLYWSLLHERWFIDENWKNLRDDYFGRVPRPLRSSVSNVFRKKMKTLAIAQGMGRHSSADIIQQGYDSLKAISDFLGDKDFMFGDQVSSYDATLYAFVASIIHSPFGPKFRTKVLECPNIIAYDKRMFNLMGF